MRRRGFLAAAIGLIASRTEAEDTVKAPRRVGVLQPGRSPEPMFDALRDELRLIGYEEGRDLVLIVRWADANMARLDALAAELVAARVDVLIVHSTSAALAAKRATSTIPLVFTGVGDPVGTGLVQSLARPGGNATGMSLLATEASSKRVELLREIDPRMSQMAMLWNDTNPSMVLRAKEAEKAASSFGLTLQSMGIHDPVRFEDAFAAFVGHPSGGLLTLVDPFTREHRKRIVDFANEHRLPAIYESREFVDVGGLISYGPDLVGMQRRAARLADRVLKGAKPAELPVEQPTSFELVINLSVARRLGIELPASLLARADEVIE